MWATRAVARYRLLRERSDLRGRPDQRGVAPCSGRLVRGTLGGECVIPLPQGQSDWACVAQEGGHGQARVRLEGTATEATRSSPSSISLHRVGLNSQNL